MRRWTDEGIHDLTDGARYFVNPTRPDLQPICHTMPADESVDALLASGWKEVDRTVYRIKMAGWRRWRDGGGDTPRPAA